MPKLMKKDYVKNSKFVFYDIVHLGIKPDGNYYVIDGQHRLVAYHPSERIFQSFRMSRRRDKDSPGGLRNRISQSRLPGFWRLLS